MGKTTSSLPRPFILAWQNGLSISTQLQQFALVQLDRALDKLTTAKHKPDTAIHETRRSVKRVRALLRLIKPELPGTVYDRENLYLRNVARQLSALRDAAVLAETLTSLKKEAAKELPRSTWRELKQQLAVLSQPSDVQKEKKMATVATKLRIARVRVEKWSLEFDDLEAVQQGLRKAYRRGQRAMIKALEEPSAENFHEWRKQVNHVRHQLQLMQALKLSSVKPTLRAFKELAELLGLKNDLAILKTQLERPRGKVQARVPPAVTALIQARDQALTQAAIRQGQQLYRPKAKAFLRSIWK